MPPLLKFDSERNTIEFNGALISLHCHHYNCGLLKAIEDIANIDGCAVIREAAAEEFFVHFKNILSAACKETSPAEALQEASELYRFMGFGRLDLSQLTAEGGIATANSSYYVISWLAKYGRRDTPVCYFTCGFIAGVLAVVFGGNPDTFAIEESQCMISHHDWCEFRVSRKDNGG